MSLSLALLDCYILDFCSQELLCNDKNYDDQVKASTNPVVKSKSVFAITVLSLRSAPSAYSVSKLSDAVCIRGAALKEPGAFFKVRGIKHLKFQNLVIFSFQITLTNYHYDIWS